MGAQAGPGATRPTQRPLRSPPWPLHPDAASQHIHTAGLSSWHLNQRSHKLCSASLGGLLDTASLDGPPALAETTAAAPAQAALRGKPSLPGCDPLLVSSSTDWAEPGEGPGSVWGTVCSGDAPVRGREGSTVAWGRYQTACRRRQRGGFMRGQAGGRAAMDPPAEGRGGQRRVVPRRWRSTGEPRGP